jgi:hypothetical protein
MVKTIRFGALICKEIFELFGHVPAVVYVTVYEPGVDKERSIAPVVGLIAKPAGTDENDPPGNPVIVGVGSLSFAK